MSVVDGNAVVAELQSQLVDGLKAQVKSLEATVDRQQRHIEGMQDAGAVGWISVDECLPDEGLNVLIANDNDLWIGNLDGDFWYTAEGMPMAVTHWAEMPEGPQ